MVRRWISVVVVLALALLGAACGSNASKTTTDEGAAGAGATTTAAGEAAGGETAAGEGEQIGLVLSGPVGVNPFLKAIKDGFEKGAGEFGYQGSAVESTDPAAIADNLRTFASQGYKLVIANSFQSVDAMTAVSKEFPDTKFALLDAVVEGSNIRNVVFREHESAFLVGVEAAKLSKSHTLGFVGAQDIPLLKKWSGGFAEGLAHVDRTDGTTSKVVTRFSGSFEDPAKCKAVTRLVIDAGADYVFPPCAAGVFGAFEAVKEANAAGRKVVTIGIDTDTRGQNPYVIDAQLKHTDVAAYETVKAFKDGAEPWGGVISLGIKEGGVGLASVDDPNEVSDEALGPELLALLKQTSADIASGKIKVKDPLAT